MRDLDWNSFDVLVVDDEQDNLDAFRFAFRKSFKIHYALGGDEALSLLDRLDPAVIVADQRMPGMSGIEFLKQAKERRPDAAGVLLTAYADMTVLIDAVNSGAVDRYVQKPWNSKELAVILRQAIAGVATLRENRRLREQLAQYAGYLEREQRDPIDFGEIAGESEAMREVAARIGEVAKAATHVLIEGEEGAEKEVVARAIHVGSPREEQPFVKVTCAAFRGDTLERELFGWRRGAFDGAFAERAGRLELAHRGTIYLDEPAPLTPSLQARLLRVLTDGEIERLGSTETTRVDVRVVLSLTPGIDEAWARAGVLPELVSRLSVFPLRLPPLRERREDIRALAEHFLRKVARRNARAATALSDEAIAKLAAYAWPGNTRELENVVERAAILSRGDVILPEHLAFTARAQPAEPPARAPRAAAPAEPEADPAGKEPAAPACVRPRLDLSSQLDDIERRELLAALDRCGGNKAEVARQFGMQRTTLYYRLKRLGIDS
ncbi:sigma-54-dependent transcriptional regulator [Sorangium atrum]|uniref:Sigma-54 dependent transcriptional regulator n=1 Tax=Sorangium atrum TaxID=2995308 RepID=A0ABT5BVY9_9BACT|nr:sigma-54 dependent transcriptional regulator [Sorangium aterium]MDC0678317.1 sigma-54 dependent transcriptional regulator [Sorangium aterium]